jgi:hypothetical protein
VRSCPNPKRERTEKSETALLSSAALNSEGKGLELKRPPELIDVKKPYPAKRVLIAPLTSKPVVRAEKMG